MHQDQSPVTFKECALTLLILSSAAVLAFAAIIGLHAGLQIPLQIGISYKEFQVTGDGVLALGLFYLFFSRVHRTLLTIARRQDARG